MHKERFKTIVVVHLFLKKADKILLLRRFNTGYEDGNYSLIAGHIDGGETLKAAMIRKAKEAVGIYINPQDLIFMHVMHRNAVDWERIDFFFVCKKWFSEPIIMEKDKCDHMQWFSKKEMPSNMVPYVKN